jgi:hypothetical protein
MPCAVDILASPADLDPRRVGAIAHSRGDRDVLDRSAIDDPRVRASVASEGGTGLS